MQFEILGEISEIETFATGSGIREIASVKAKDAEIRIETTRRMHQQRRLSNLARKAKDLRGAP
jgi:hypothetical protein